MALHHSAVKKKYLDRYHFFVTCNAIAGYYDEVFSIFFNKDTDYTLDLIKKEREYYVQQLQKHFPFLSDTPFFKPGFHHFYITLHIFGTSAITYPQLDINIMHDTLFLFFSNKTTALVALLRIAQLRKNRLLKLDVHFCTIDRLNQYNFNDV
jgi:hypothetical protein